MPLAEGLSYDWQGPESAPVLILSSGLGGQGGYWARSLPALAARFRVLSYDQRGTGGSGDETREALSVEDMAADLLALMDSLGVVRASVIGHALGAHIGLALGLAAPGRLERLVAINAWARLDPLTARCFDVRLRLLRDSGPEAFFLAQPLFLYPGAWISEHDAELRAETVAQLAHFRGAKTIERRVAALRAFDPLPRLAAFRAPVLALCAKDDLLVPWTASERLAEALPEARLEVLPSGGHACNVADPASFDRIVGAWLSREP